MKRLVSLLFLALCLCAAGQSTNPGAPRERPTSPAHAAETASVVGTVINSTTSKPLDGVHVVLIGYANSMPSVIYGAMSNAAGHFSIQAVPPAVYLIGAERRGFILVPGKGGVATKSLELKPGEQLQDTLLEMAPRAILSGRVLDEYGDPAMDILMTAVPRDPQARAGFFRQTIATDDRGEFRLTVPPGVYYIKARVGSLVGPASGPPEIRTDGTSETTYLETYYPNATEVEAGTPVEVLPGQELSGLELHLARSPVLSIGGKVDGIPGEKDLAIIRLEGAPDRSHSFGLVGPGVFSSVNGRFELGHLGSGLYKVYATWQTGEQELQSQVVELTLTDSNVEDLSLTLATGSEVTGTIETASSPVKAPATVKLQPAGVVANDRSSAGDVAPDGTFKIKNVFPEKYRVLIDPLTENSFVKTVFLNGQHVPDGLVDLSGGVEGAKLKIAVSAKGGQVSGRVQDANGGVFPFAVVVLLPDQTDASRFDQWRVSHVGGDGAYNFNGLAPGRYRLLATPPFSGMVRDIEDAVRQYGARAETMEIKEGDRIFKNLTMSAGEDRNGMQK